MQAPHTEELRFTDEAPRVSRHPAARHDILLDDWRVSYALERVARRSIGMVVSAEGLSVRAPRWVAVADIERALKARARWICTKLQDQRERLLRREADRLRWVDGGSLPYLGQGLLMQLDPSATGVRHVKAEGACGAGRLHIGVLPGDGSAEQVPVLVAGWMKRQARSHFQARVQHFSPYLGVAVGKLSLSSARTRWGSASANGSVRLHWRLMHFDPAVIDYVVVHELAHLREMNHSARFWSLVESVMPDYQQHRQTLRRASMPEWG